MAAPNENSAVPAPHASLRRRRHSRSLASLLCPQPPSFIRLDSLARLSVAAFTGLAAAVEAATPVVMSLAVASAWYAGEIFPLLFLPSLLSLVFALSCLLSPHWGKTRTGVKKNRHQAEPMRSQCRCRATPCGSPPRRRASLAL